MVETEKINWLDCFKVLRKMIESEKKIKDVKQAEQIAKYERLAKEMAKRTYAKTAEAQLAAETIIISTRRGLNINNERNITRGQNTIQVEPKEVKSEDDIDRDK